MLLISPTSDTCYWQPLLKVRSTESLLCSNFVLLFCFCFCFNISLLFNLNSPSFLRQTSKICYISYTSTFSSLLSTLQFYPSSFQEPWKCSFSPLHAVHISTSRFCSHGFLMKELYLATSPTYTLTVPRCLHSAHPAPNPSYYDLYTHLTL